MNNTKNITNSLQQGNLCKVKTNELNEETLNKISPFIEHSKQLKFEHFHKRVTPTEFYNRMN